MKAKDVKGPWCEPVLVKAAKGIIDTTPLWDEDGRVYLAHAYAGSRAGLKSVIAVCELSADATRTIGPSRIVFDGHEAHETCEGPKFYKRNGYYYMFFPAGGVPTGWQVVARSKNVYGPYEWRTVMAQGDSPVNGPHQGGWVDTPAGEDWFMHFQDVGAAGRLVHLQPMKWVNDWPVIVGKNRMWAKRIRFALRRKVMNSTPIFLACNGNGTQISTISGISVMRNTGACASILIQ